MKRTFLVLALASSFVAAGPLAAQEEVDAARIQREVGKLVSDYGRSLGARVSALRRDAQALGYLREGIRGISSFQRDHTLEQARAKVAEARSFLEKQGPLSDPAYRAIARVEDLLRPPVANEPAERTKAKLLAALEPFQTDLLSRASVLNSEADFMRRQAGFFQQLESQARGSLPGVIAAMLDLSKIAIDNEADAGR